MIASHIFIVGLPRTGTKLMQSVIMASEGHICRLTSETWYLGDAYRSGVARRIRTLGDMNLDERIDALVELMYSKNLRGTYWKQLGGKYLPVKPEQMRDLLLSSDRTLRGIYDVIMRVPVAATFGPDAASRAIVGDKMPGNLYHVPQLLDWFPNSKIVHTFRDPRAILASEWKRLIDQKDDAGWWTKMPRSARTLLIVLYVTLTWNRAARLHKRYSRLYPENYRLFRYEDLVSDPHRTAHELCNFLGIGFGERMLTPAQRGSSFGPQGELGFDRSALDRWREHLSPGLLRWMNIVTGSRLAEFGYES